MDDPFAKRASYGYAILGFLACGVGFFVWAALTGRFQPLVTAWDWLNAVLVILLITTGGSVLVVLTIKELRTTFDETGVQQRGLFKTTQIAWSDVKALDDLAFTNVVLKTSEQKLTINLMFYYSPYHALLALRKSVQPEALVNELKQVQARWRDDRYRNTIGLWVSLGLGLVCLLLGLLWERVWLACLLVVLLYIMEDFFDRYQRRGLETLDGA